MRLMMRSTICSLIAGLARAGSFVDDAGVSHEWTASQPNIVIGATDAISMFHFGMGADQISGTFGERATSGSNFGGYYHNGNVANHGDWSTDAFDPNAFPASPNAAEVAALAQIADLSPDCSGTNYWCASFDHKILDENGWPDLIIEGSYGGPFALTKHVLGNATERGIPVIMIGDQCYHKACDPDVAPMGFIEVAKRYEELAIALGVLNVQDTVENDKVALCHAVADFKDSASTAQENGVRALAAYLPYGPAADNGDVGGFLMSPDRDQVLMMLEELGMPIYHVDVAQSSSWEYAVTEDWSAGTMSATNLMSSGELTGEPVPYNVDFWLHDVRVTLDVSSVSFAAAWPHPAIVAKQYAYWPSGGHVFSYQHAIEILTAVGTKLDTAERLTPKTKCTNVNAINGEDHRTTGLGPGEYACYNPVEYAWCDDIYVRETVTSTTKKKSTGPITPLSILLPVLGFVLGLCFSSLLFYVVMRRKSSKNPKSLVEEDSREATSSPICKVVVDSTPGVEMCKLAL